MHVSLGAVGVTANRRNEMSTAATSLPETGQSADIARVSVRLPAIAAMVLGVVLLFGAGFAQPEALHAATHDVRHAFAMPCH